MSLDLTDDKSTLVQVMAWTSHYLSQCWPRSLLPYDVTKPQWVKTRQGVKNLNLLLAGTVTRVVDGRIQKPGQLQRYVTTPFCAAKKLMCLMLSMTVDFGGQGKPRLYLWSVFIRAGWETSARPLANASENLAGWVENRPGRQGFCISYIRDYPVRVSNKKF